jgi:hypothetical protein
MIVTSSISLAAVELHQPVPFFDEGTMMRVPVNVFGKTLYFILDSGFTTSAMDAGYKPLLGEPITSSFSGGTPLGNDATLPAFHCPEMSIAGNPLGLDKIMCLDLKMARFVSGKQCDGILGMDFFEIKIVSVDFDRNLISLIQAMPENVRGSFVAIPLQKTPQFFTMDLVVNNGKRLTLMVETGDNSSLSLNTDAWQAVFGNDKTNVIVVTVADAANQIAQSKIGVIQNTAMGKLNYTNLHATFILNSTSPSHVGLGFFRRHHAIFDFANQMIYLEPGQTFSMPDKEDMSGLHLLREGERTFVYSVDEESPASMSGIRPKDVIESVNGKSADSMTMKTVRQILQSHDGDKVALRVRRGDNALEIEFTLKRAL